jgi:hypothetical protein
MAFYFVVVGKVEKCLGVNVSRVRGGREEGGKREGEGDLSECLM